jgi:hypothetical protein
VGGIRRDVGRFMHMFAQCIEGGGVLKGSVRGGWVGVCVENRLYRVGSKQENDYLESRLGCGVLGC